MILPASVPSTPDILLRMSNLSMRFGGLLAIDNVSFEVMAGTIMAVIGPNGAGKTTLFNCVTGFYRPTSGIIAVPRPQGQDLVLNGKPAHRIVREAGIVRTFQNIRLFGGMTALENLLAAQHQPLMAASGFSLAGLARLPSYRRAEERAMVLACQWLERVGLLDDANRPAAELSYGAQRRLEIARAMCLEPRLLCLDEPAAGLNPRESAELTGLLRDLRTLHGCTLLLIEHDMSVVMDLSDQITVLDYGRVIASGTPAAIKNDPVVIRAYLGENDEA
jgi:branched-chain amino acid transport system ATP-binding protein